MNENLISKLTIDKLNAGARGMKFSRDFIVYDDCYLPNVFYKENILDCSGLVYVKSGRFSIMLNGISLSAETGQLFFFRNDDQVTDIMYSPDCKGWIFAVSGQLSDESLAIEGLSQFSELTKHGSVVTPSEDVGRLIELYGEILKIKYHSGITAVEKTLRALFSDVYNGIEYADGFINDRTSSAGNTYRRFLSLLGQQNPKPRELGWYADRLGVSTKYLTTISRKISGETAMYRINEAIITDIRKMLRYSDYPVSVVAEKLGFNNSAFFGKYVKKHLHLTPSQLRKYLREKDQDIL